MERSDAHGGDANKGEEADDESAVVVRLPGEQEGQGCPEVCERCCCQEGDEAGYMLVSKDDRFPEVNVSQTHLEQAPGVWST